jgi:PAS domain-containing protein
MDRVTYQARHERSARREGGMRAWGAAAMTEAEMYRQIITEAPDAIILADRDGRIRLWNAAAVRMFGYTEAEVLGQSLDCIIVE